MNVSLMRQWREAADVSLREVADLTGLSVPMLSRVERGERRLAPLTKIMVARRLGVAVADLFEVDPIDPDASDDGGGARP